MKLHFTLIALLFFTLSSLGQSLSEKEAVLKKCIELPQIQEQLENRADNPKQTVYIMQHAVTFPEEMNLSDSGIELKFMSKDDIVNQKIEDYFRFDTFEITGNTAEIDFDFHYNRHTNAAPGRILYKLSLQSVDSEWNITDSTIK